MTAEISKLHKLTKLVLENTTTKSLEFIENLENLVSFYMVEKTDDSMIENILPQMKKLKNFEYPLTDLSILIKCPLVERIFVDALNYINTSALEGRIFKSVMIINPDDQESAMSIIDELKKYCQIDTYGFIMNSKK